MPWYLYYPNIIFAFFVAVLQKTPESGAYTSVYCAVMMDGSTGNDGDDGDDDDGKEKDDGFYFVNSARHPLEAVALNDEDAKELWDLSCKLVKLR